MPDPATRPRCSATTKNDVRCTRSAVAPHFIFCHYHDPARPADARPQNSGASTANGNRQRAVAAARGELRTAEQCQAALEAAYRIAQQARGVSADVDVARSRTMIQAANSALRAIEKVEMQRELDELRALVEQHLGAEARQ
jgi:hypothetical protein